MGEHDLQKAIRQKLISSNVAKVLNENFDRLDEVEAKVREYFDGEDIEMSYLANGSNAVAINVKCKDKEYVLKVGGKRKGFPNFNDPRIIESLIYEEMGKDFTIELQRKVKTYSGYDIGEADIITGKEAYELLMGLIEDGIVVCDFDMPVNNLGRDIETGKVVVIDKEFIYTKEELDKEGPTVWDDTCYRAIFGAERRKGVGQCFGPGRLKRAAKEKAETEAKGTGGNRGKTSDMQH